ncbi:MAG: alpha-glucan family phosphorylase [Actinomycetes bacterium]
MKAVQTFTVISHLPESLEPLREVAMNLGWSYDERAIDLVRRIDQTGWGFEGRDPALALATESQERLDTLAADSTFTSLAAGVRDQLRTTLDAPRWFQMTFEPNHPDGLKSVGYFSPEFGIAAALPQYSGGLGVLAGDHLKAANDLGVPLTGVGLFYRHGYFRQHLDRRGWQQERFPRLDPRAMALTEVTDVRVSVELAGVRVHAALWQAQIGRISLYLLDTDIDENDDASRLVCDRLYGGGPEERIRQEIVLGIGGIRALQALGKLPEVFHLNEGHAGFLALERIRRAILDDGLSYSEARAAVRPGAIFTTHTPVPAGIDRFPRELIEKYFSNWCRDCGLTLDDLMALGHEPGTTEGEMFNMAALSLRLAGESNGVSALHGAVSRHMFAGIWPDLPENDVPIHSVTNGVHARTWATPEMSALYERTLGVDWPEAPVEVWKRLETIPNRDLWAVRRDCRERLVQYARRRLRESAIARGASESQVSWTGDVLDPAVLTIGFARRFATYKRATLLFRDLDRLKALLLNEERPVQIVFAGKAHPADDDGKELLRQVATLAADLDVRHRLVLLEDYDITVARMLVGGVDVWLNTPLRPLEACGTSGMKAVFNGVLNCSVLDGWWDEMFDSDVGWAIPSAEWQDDVETRNDVEAISLFNLLERQIVPLFYKRGDGGLPTEWLAKVKASMSRLGPRVSASRMIRDYTTTFYEPAARRTRELRANGDARAKEFVEWKRFLQRSWPAVLVTSTAVTETPSPTGTTYHVTAQAVIGDLGPDDVEVQILFGAVDLDDELREPTCLPMTFVGDGDQHGWRRYGYELDFDQAGNFGFTVRVVPRHRDLTSYTQLGKVAWAPTPTGLRG